VLVVEEGEPVVEMQVKALAKDVAPEVELLGRYTGHVQRVGELNPDSVKESIAKALGLLAGVDEEREQIKKQIEGLVAPRSSTLCAGCPHLGTYWALKQALKKVGGRVPIVNGDIGCYEQGGYGIAGKKYEPSDSSESRGYPIQAPYETLDTNYIMGGGVGLMQGQFHAGYADGALIAVAGDSTYFHACLPAVVNAVYNKARGVFVVMDNYWTAMTGHQPDPCTGLTATGEQAKALSIENVARALGVEVVETTDPYDLKQTQEAIERAIESGKFAIVVSRRVCTLQALRLKQYTPVKKVRVNEQKCTGCRICISFGCPATTFDTEKRKAGIDPILCVDCGMCAQVCPYGAIEEVKK
jgi:indolepyruvate ferredoxin oxidoreductase alpha subunit